MFIFLTFLAAVLLETLGTVISVIGLSSLFMGSAVIVTLAIALDFGKLIAVSFLYKYWKKIGWVMRGYMTVASFVLILITSAGAFGFLSGEFQKAISDTNTAGVMITALTEEQGRLQKRKEEIDKQISQLKDDNVRGRTRLMSTFGPEIKRINDRLGAIDAELPALKVETIKKNVKVGPIIYVAEAFNTTPEQAVKWIILLIIFVFDPLAIALLIAGNYLVEQRDKDRAAAAKAAKDLLDSAPTPNTTAVAEPHPFFTGEMAAPKKEIVDKVEEVLEEEEWPHSYFPEIVDLPAHLTHPAKLLVEEEVEELPTEIIAGSPTPAPTGEPVDKKSLRKVVEEDTSTPIREVITIKQLKKPHRSTLDDRPDEKITPIEVEVRQSLLEGLDDKFADIEITDEPLDVRRYSKLATAYSDEQESAGN